MELLVSSHMYNQGVTRDQVASYYAAASALQPYPRCAMNMALYAALIKTISIALKKAKLLPASGSAIGQGEDKHRLTYICCPIAYSCIMLLLA
jgi:hypothetical protein